MRCSVAPAQLLLLAIALVVFITIFDSYEMHLANLTS